MFFFVVALIFVIFKQPICNIANITHINVDRKSRQHRGFEYAHSRRDVSCRVETESDRAAVGHLDRDRWPTNSHQRSRIRIRRHDSLQE